MTSPEEVAFAMMAEAIHGYIEVMGVPHCRHEEVYEVILDLIIEETAPKGES